MQFYRLSEIAAATGVTPRTIRYYITEGLLPPPQGSGPAAVYTVGHRDRLELIGQLKARYISLREIKRQLGALSDAKVRAALAEDAAVAEPVADLSSPTAVPVAAGSRAPAQRIAAPQVFTPTTSPQPALGREQWERIVLADGIELHVRDDRRQERLLLEALIRQARTLLGDS